MIYSLYHTLKGEIMNNNKAVNINTGIYLAKTSTGIAILSMFPVVVLHNYLISLGVSYHDIGLIGTINSIVSSAVMFLFSGMADSCGKLSGLKKRLVIMLIGMSANNMAMLGLKIFFPNTAPYTAYIVLLISGILYTSFSNAHGILDMVVIVRAGLTGNNVGRIIGMSGIFAGVVSILCSTVVNYFSASTVHDMYIWLPMISNAAIILTVILTLSFRRAVPDVETNTKHESPFKAYKGVIKLAQFKAFLAPGILRGMQYGVVYFVNSIGITRMDNDPTLIGYLAIALTIGDTLGCTMLTALQKKIGTGNIYLLANIISAAGLIGTAFAPSVLTYTIATFIVFLGQGIINYSFPIAVYEKVPSEWIGRFSSARLLLYTLSSALFMYVFGAVMEPVGYEILCAVACAALIIGGICFKNACKREY